MLTCWVFLPLLTFCGLDTAAPNLRQPGIQRSDIFCLQNCRYLSPGSSTLPSPPFLVVPPSPFDDIWLPPLLMSTPHHPPWSTNSVPCHPISRHTGLSGRGRGETMQIVLFYRSTTATAPVNTHNTNMSRNCRFHVTTTAFDSITMAFSITIVSNIFGCARVTYYYTFIKTFLTQKK